MKRLLWAAVAAGSVFCFGQLASAAHQDVSPASLDTLANSVSTVNYSAASDIQLADHCYRRGYYRPSYHHGYGPRYRSYYRPRHYYGGGYGGYGGGYGGYGGHYYGGRSGVSFYLSF